jgi:hypothetical protein
MSANLQTPEVHSIYGSVKPTPQQGAESASGSACVSPVPKYKDLEEWLKDVSTASCQVLNMLPPPAFCVTVLINGTFPFTESRSRVYW